MVKEVGTATLSGGLSYPVIHFYEAYEAFSDGEYKSGFKNGLYGTIDIGLCFIPVSKLSNLYKVGKNLKKATSISKNNITSILE